MPRVTKKVAAAKLREAAKKLKRQATAALLTPTPLVTTEPKPELKYDGEAEWPIAGGSSLPLEPAIEIDVKQEPVYTAGETQETQEWEVELKEELVDVENPADLDAEQDPIGGQGGGQLLTPQAKEEKEEDFRCQFCLKLFQESGGRGIITKAKIEFALGLRKWGGPRPNCCEGCRRMFDLFYEFKQSCLMALAQPAELFIWSFNKGPAQFVDLKSNRKKPKSKGWKPVKIDDCKKLNSLKVEVFQGIGTSAKLEGLDPGAVIVEALPAGLQQDVQVAEPVVEPETVTIVALSSGLQQQDDKEAVCVICHETFPDGLSLRHHLTKHYPPEPKKKRIRIRKAPVNKEKKKYCGHCRKWFSDKELYAQHKADCIETFKRNKPPPPEFACSLCPRKFHRQLDLTYHNNMHNDPLDRQTTNMCVTPSSERLPESEPSMKTKVKPKSYSNAALDNILTSIQNGVMNVHYASKRYGIPRGTLQYRLSSRYKNKGTTGPYTILTNKEEQDIVDFLKDMERKGFPITRKSLIYRLSCFLKENPRVNPFKNNKPGKGWFRGFLNRHKDLALRTPDSVTAASAMVSEQDIRGWFHTVRNYLIDNDLVHILDDPSRILTGDETGFCVNPVAKQVLVSRGKNNVSIVEAGSSEQNTTVMFTFSADGSALPPDVILAQKRLSRELSQSFPTEWGLGISENGWMDTKNFVLYIKKIVHPFLVKKGVRFPVIYFVDGHTSHTAIEAAEACRKLGIILIALFPNATRILQPVDVAIFKPLSNSWTEVFEIWKINNAAAPISLCTFGPLLQDAMTAAFKQCTIINGFAACGLFPYNPNAIDYEKCIVRTIYEHEVLDASPFELTVQMETAQEETIQEVTIEETVKQEIVQEAFQNACQEETVQEEIHYLVPARAMDEALETIGTSQIQMYKYEDEANFSAED